jgi:hypothetical protein
LLKNVPTISDNATENLNPRPKCQRKFLTLGHISKNYSNLKPIWPKKNIPTSGQYVYAKLIFLGDKLSWRDI